MSGLTLARHPECCSLFCRQLTLPPALQTPRKCRFIASNAQHQLLVARFAGNTFEMKVLEFSGLYYRCVRIHCGKQFSLAVASAVIADWVAACYSAAAPIIAFDSPILMAAIISPILASGTAASADSTQESFQSFVSTDASAAALVVAAAEAALLAAAADSDAETGWGPALPSDDFFD